MPAHVIAFNSFDASVLATLKKRIAEERQKGMENTMSGRCSDHSEYRYACGYIKALNDIDTLIEEISADLRKG